MRFRGFRPEQAAATDQSASVGKCCVDALGKTGVKRKTTDQANPHKTCTYKGKWRAQGDDFRTFLGDFVPALWQIDFPAGWSL
jgi:hypothetical protein